MLSVLRCSRMSVLWQYSCFSSAHFFLVLGSCKILQGCRSQRMVISYICMSSLYLQIYVYLYFAVFFMKVDFYNILNTSISIICIAGSKYVNSVVVLVCQERDSNLIRIYVNLPLSQNKLIMWVPGTHSSLSFSFIKVRWRCSYSGSTLSFYLLIDFGLELNFNGNSLL